MTKAAYDGFFLCTLKGRNSISGFKQTFHINIFPYPSLNSMYSSYTSKESNLEKSGEYERFNL
jgi:hypothetical protein